MLKFRKKIFLFLTIIGLVALLASCTEASNSVRINIPEEEYEIRLHTQMDVKPIVRASGSLSVDDVELVYESSDEEIVKYVDGTLYPQAEGEAEIKVYWKDKDIVFDRATVKVIKPALPELVYTQNVLFKNEVKGIEYSLRYNYTDAAAKFESLTPDIAEITADGEITAHAVGEAEIKVTVSDASESYEEVVKVTVVESDFAIKAYELDGGAFVGEAPAGYNSLVELVLPTPVKAGYDFRGWYDGVALIGAIAAGTTGDIELLTAIWTATVYGISYDYAGGEEVADAPRAYTIEDEVVLPTPSRAGYEFAGWTMNGEAVEKIALGSTGDVQVVANWKAVEYAISYDYAGGEEVADAPKSFTVEDEVALPTPQKAGYEFAGWTLNGEAVEKIALGTVGDVKVVATWKAVSYTITYDYAGGEEVADAPKSFTVEDEVVLPAPSKAGHIFIAWTLNGEVVEKIAKGTIGDVTVVATWEEIKDVKVSYDLAGGQWAENYITFGDKLIALFNELGESTTVTTKESFKATSHPQIKTVWNKAETLAEYKWLFEFALAEITAAAEANNYTGESYYANVKEMLERMISGDTTAVGGSYADGRTIFRWWLQIVMTANRVYTADIYEKMMTDYSQPEHMARFEAALNGIKERLEPGATFPTPSRAGYEFAGWSLDGQIITAVPEGATADLALVAEWTAVEYSISFDLAGGSIAGAYATREEMVADFMKDFGAYAGITMTTPAEYWSNGSKTSFWKNAEMHAKWSWIFEALVPLAKAQGVSLDYINNMLLETPSVSGYATQNVAVYLLGINNDMWNADYKATYGGLSSKWTTVDCTSEEALNSWVAYVGMNMTYTIEDEVVLPTPEKENYDFKGWTLDGVVVEKIAAGSTGDKVLVATWEQKYVVSAISYELNEGVLPEGAPTSYNEGVGLATLPVPTREGYIFAGWLMNGEKVESISTEQTGAVVLTAQWTARVYSSISYELNEGVLPEGAPTQYEEGQGVAELPVPTKEGHVFDGWYIGEEKVTSISAEQTGDVVLTAKWVEYNEYSISYELSEGSWTKVTEVVYDTYDAVVDAVLADFGLSKGFSIWTSNVDDKFIANLEKWGFLLDYFMAVRPNDKFTAVIADTKAGNDQTGSVNPYVLTGELKAFANKKEQTYSSAGIVSADYSKEEIQAKLFEYAPKSHTNVEEIEYPTTYVQGTGVELVAPYKAGYDFAGWYNAEGQLVTEVTAQMTGDLVLTAKWRAASGEEGVVFVGADRAYKTLAEALAVVLPGETIKVDAGSYEGAEITVANVTIAGPNAGVNPVTSERAAEAVFTSDVIVSADDVTIDGIQITGATRVMGGAAGCDGTTVKNVWSYQSTTNSGASNTAPFYFSSATSGVLYSNLVFENLKMSDRSDGRPMAMYFDQTENVAIRNCSFVATRSSYNDAIKFGNASDYGITGNLEIVGCHFENFAQYVIWFLQYEEGNYTIENNTFLNCGQTSSSHCAVRFAAYGGAADGVSSIKFNYNTVDNSYMLVRIDAVASRTADTQPVVVNYNKLLNCGATYYVKNSNAYNIDATNNYYDVAPTASVMLNCTWEPYYANADDVPQYGQPLTVFPVEYVLNGGTIEGTAPAKYDGNVGMATLPTIVKAGYVFEGWVMNGEIVTSIPVGTSGKVTLTAQFREDGIYVSKNGESYAYATIAEALAVAKEGDKIIILAGEWEESVTVSVANLSIVGPNRGVSGQSSERAAEAIIKGVISVPTSATNLTIDGLAFTGAGRVVASATSGTYNGFTFKNNKVYDTNASTTPWVVNRYKMDAVVEFRLASGGKCKNFAILDNSFVNCPSVNVMVNRPHNLTVDGNLFKNFTQDGFRIAGGYTHGVHAFTNNVFEVENQGDAHTGIFFYSLSGSDAWPIVEVSNNVFKNLGQADSSKFSGALAANFYQECGLEWHINNNIFDNCYNYMWLRNNGADASNWSSEINNNQFLGLPVDYYYGTYTGSDTESTNPHLNVFGANYYEDNDGNVITDMSQIADKFFHTATIGTALAEKPEAVVSEKFEFWTITYDLAGGTARGLVTEYHKATGTITLPTPEWNIYHEFTGWTLNGEVVTEIAEGTKGDLHLVATWVELEGDPVTLNFELNGGNWQYGSFEEICLDLLADYNAWGGTNYTQANLPTGAWVNINIHNFFYSEGMKAKWSWLAGWLGEVGGSANKPGCKALLDYEDPSSFAAKNGNYIYEVSYEFRAIMRGSSITSNSSYKTPDYSEPTLNQQIWAPLNAVQTTTIDTTVGKVMTLPVAHKVFLSFVGWYDNAEFAGDPITEITVAETNPTYYAKFIDLHPVTNVNVTNAITSMKRYDSYQLTWEVLPAETSNKAVKFESSDPAVISVDTEGGLVANKNGNATIKVISTANEEIFAEISIAVYSPAHIEGSYATNSYVSVGQDIVLNAEIVDGEGTINWSSSDETKATVANGVVTGVAEGLVEITATSSNDPELKLVFIVSVMDGEISDVAQFVIDQHYSNVYTSYGLGIGSGTPAYYADIYGSVSTILYNHVLEIDEQYKEAGNKTNDYYANANTEFEGIQFVTYHYTAGMAATADTDNHASYFTGGSADVSIHYVTGNHGSNGGAETAEIFATLDHKHGAWHAGDSNSRYYSNSTTYDSEGMRRFMWIPTGVAYDGADLLNLEWSASDDFYFEINGKKTSIKLPETYDYKSRNTDHIYNADGTISSQSDFTFSWAKFEGRTPESFFNSQGFVAKVIDGYYYMCPTWWSYGQVVEGRICAVGGNMNSIGIESCVNEGSDLWLTWQITGQLIASLLYQYDLGVERVKGHHFFDGKDCPQPLLENDLAIWNENIKNIQAELALLTDYAEYDFTFASNNAEVVSENGRIIAVGENSQTVSYTVTITKGGEVIDTITLASYVPGIYEK